MIRTSVWKIGTAVLGMLILAAQVEAGEASVLKTSKDRLSYTIGVDVARSLKRLGAEPDLDLLVKGLRDDLAGEKLLMSEEDLRATLTAYYQELRQKAVDARMQAAEQNKKEGDAFLAENKTKEGVVVLPSGLQYRILKVGTAGSRQMPIRWNATIGGPSSTEPNSTAPISGPGNLQPLR